MKGKKEDSGQATIQVKSARLDLELLKTSKEEFSRYWEDRMIVKLTCGTTQWAIMAKPGYLFIYTNGDKPSWYPEVAPPQKNYLLIYARHTMVSSILSWIFQEAGRLQPNSMRLWKRLKTDLFSTIVMQEEQGTYVELRFSCSQIPSWTQLSCRLTDGDFTE